MNEKEKDLIAKIDKINEMLNVVCIELNNYNKIDDYEIELNEGVITTCLSKKTEKKYRIIVTCKTSLESKGEE